MDASIKVTEVPARRGVRWLIEAFNLFQQKPLAWIGLVPAGWSMTFGLLLLPLIGGVIANFLQPVFFASFAIVALRQLHGEKILMGDLFLGFRRNLRAAGEPGRGAAHERDRHLRADGAAGPADGAAGRQAFYGQRVRRCPERQGMDPDHRIHLTVAIKGAVWFAPPLIALHDMSMAHAVRWSVYACLANMGAMVLYGLALFTIFFGALIPWLLGLIVVIPVMAISTYIGYREVFEASEPGA
jgi:hypothetical protein